MATSKPTSDIDAPVPSEPVHRDFLDVPTTRQNLFDGVIGALQTSYPVSNNQFELHVENPKYASTPKYSLNDQKNAILKQQSLTWPIKGDWVLKDKQGQEVHRVKNKLVARVPYMTDRGTFIYNGVEYTVANQQRLRPGVYARQKENGELESHVNLIPGTGKSFRLHMEPDTGVFKIQVEQSHMPLFPILRALGATPKDFIDHWGPDLYMANARQGDPSIVNKVFAKLARPSVMEQHRDNPSQGLKEIFAKAGLDPEVSQRNLGAPHANIDHSTLLAATRKLLHIHQGKVDPDDRDSQANQTVHGPEDLFAERIRKDSGRIAKQLLWKATHSRNLNHINSSALSPQLNAVLLTSGLGSPLSEINPVEIADQLVRITRLGEGGMPSRDAIPAEARSVQPSQLGYIDVIAGPESEAIGIDTRAAWGARKGKDNLLYQQLINARTGKPEYRSARDAVHNVLAFPGELEKGTPTVRAMVDGRMTYVPREKVDYAVPSGNHMFALTTNLIPGLSGIKGGRGLMGAKMVKQALPLVNAEAPLVQSAHPDGGSYHEHVGRHMGTVHARDHGIVQRVGQNGITVRYRDGSVHEHELYQNFPFNYKSVSGSSRIEVLKATGKVWTGQIADFKWSEGDRVRSIDPVTKQSAWMLITGFIRHQNDKRLYKVQLLSGREITVTEDHSLVTTGDDGSLVPVFPKDCVVGRTRLPVAMLPSSPVRNQHWGYELGVVAGLYLAEGHIPKARTGKLSNLILIAVAPDDRAKEVAAALHAVVGVGDRRAYRLKGSVAITNAKLSAWLVRNFGRMSGSKFVHDDVVSAPTAFREGLVAGYLAGDGLLTVDSNGAIQISAHSMSVKLRDGLVRTLASLGVFCTVVTRSDNAHGFRVVSSHLSKLDRWFFYSDRQTKFKQLSRSNYRSSPFSAVPVTPKGRKTMYRGNRISMYVYKTANYGYVAKERLTRFKGAFGDWGRSDVMWDVITDISEVGHEEFVYDFSVKDSENFAIEHGVVVHNTFLHNTPSVRAGDVVTPGQLLAKSNYTNDKGELALGLNFKTGYMPYQSEHGDNYEDAIVISESAAKRLTSEHMKQQTYDPSAEGVKVDRNHYLSVFPSKFNRVQLASIGDDGVVKPGTRVTQGDPLVLSVKTKKPQQGVSAVHRHNKSYTNDDALTWSFKHPGIVTDIHRDADGIKVTVKSYHSMQVGDKLSGVFGDKGVCGAIVPDDQMPRGEDGKPLEVLLNPLGVVTRTNPSQLIEAALGKVAAKTGKKYVLPSFGTDLLRHALSELDKHGLSDTEKVYDPHTRRTNEVFTGNRFLYKLYHEAESKETGRSDAGSYTSEGQPAKTKEESAKRLGLLDMNALISHGVPAVIRDSKLVRGQRNDAFWAAFRTGKTPPAPETPFIYNKWLAHLQGAGVHLRETSGGLQLMAMRDSDIDQLSRGALSHADSVDMKENKPIPGGLFDVGLTGGHHGNQWTHLNLPDAIPNPVMEEPVRRLLGLTQQAFEEKLMSPDGSQWFKDQLGRLDVDKEISAQRHIINSGRRSKRDEAVKKLGYLTTLKETGIKPAELLLTKFPVIPPSMRPVTKMGNMQLTSDANFLYQELHKASENLEDARKASLDTGAERLSLYHAAKAVSGLGDPLSVKLQEKGVSGLLTHVFGKGSPKGGQFQRRVVGGTLDTVGRAAITPNPALDMDHVGIPESRAWQVYRPFILRRLARQYNVGSEAQVPVTELAQWVARKDPRARQALLDEMQERPVMINRAPVWHRYGYMAAWPKLVKGETLQISPITTPGFGADFDGNCVVYNTEIRIEIDWTMLYAPENVQHVGQFKELCMRVTGQTFVPVTGVTSLLIKIGDFPKTGQPVKDRNGADVYTVPSGVFVTGYDPATCQLVRSPVEFFTVEETCPCVLVTTARRRQVEVSDNESLAVFDPATACLAKMKPADAVGKWAAVVRQAPQEKQIPGTPGDFELGWWYAALACDGWISQRMVGYSKLQDEKLEAFESIARRLINPNFISHRYVEDRGVGKFGRSKKIHLTGTEFAGGLLNVYRDRPEDSTLRGSLFKKLPDELVYSQNRSTLLGLFSGMMDGDCSLVVNTVKAKPQLSCRFNTSSSAMVQSLLQLGQQLGVRMSVTTNPAKGSSVESYIVIASSPDLQRIASELTLVGKQEQQWLELFKKQELMKDDTDVVPISKSLVRVLMPVLRANGHNTLYAALSKAAKTGSLGRSSAQRILEIVVACDHEHFVSFKQMTSNRNVCWDRIDEVVPTYPQSVFDFALSGVSKVYAISNGLIIWDTMNYSVPVSEDAVREAIAKMLPSRNLLSVRDFGVHMVPRQEYLHGLFKATHRIRDDRPVRTFASTQDVLRALRRGEIGVDDPVEVVKG